MEVSENTALVPFQEYSLQREDRSPPNIPRICRLAGYCIGAPIVFVGSLAQALTCCVLLTPVCGCIGEDMFDVFKANCVFYNYMNPCPKDNHDVTQITTNSETTITQVV